MSKLQNEDFKSESDLTGAGGLVSQLLNDTKVYVTASGINKKLSQAISDGDIAGSVSFVNENITLSSTNITNGYIDLTDEAQSGSLWVYGPTQEYLAQTLHYTTNVVSLVTRVTWANEYASGGVKELVEGDKIFIKFVPVT